MSILMDALRQQQLNELPRSPSKVWRNIALGLALVVAVLVGFIVAYFVLPKPAPEPLQHIVDVKPPKPAIPATPSLIASELLLSMPAIEVVPKPEVVTETLAVKPPVVTITTNTAIATPEPEIPAELRERFASALVDTANNSTTTRLSSNLTSHSAPAVDISLLDADLQRQIPKLRFEAHVYATQPAQRWVKVNGKSLQEGQWITADVRLREITPQYVLLEFGQQLFSMRALSEW